MNNNIEIKLYQYPHVAEDVRKLNNELNTIISCKRETYNTVKANVITDMPRGTDTGNQVLNAVEKIIDRYQSRINEITQEINALLDLQRDICQAYYNNTEENTLTQEERRVIELFYFSQYKWHRVGYTMKYSIKQCQRFRDTALEKINREYINMSLNVSKHVV